MRTQDAVIVWLSTCFEARAYAGVTKNLPSSRKRILPSKHRRFEAGGLQDHGRMILPL